MIAPEFVSSAEFLGSADVECLVAAVTDTGELRGGASELDAKLGGRIAAILAACGPKGLGKSVEIAAPDGLKVKWLVVMSIGAADALNDQVLEQFGAFAAKKATALGVRSVVIDGQIGAGIKAADECARVAFGASLGAYRFDKYRTRQKPDAAKGLVSIQIASAKPKPAEKAYAGLSHTAEGVGLARDLMMEPPNVLHPEEFAKRLKTLEDLGVEITILGEKEMRKQGFGALLGVGQGSVRDSQLVVMSWKGGKASEPPLALVGKGVCFDTGGISLKPAAGMEDMKGDMGGAAAVAGTMRSIAGRQAKANVIGIVGLVENMPDGNAQRPGDIVTSLSGQTIEVLNTDAEGRLVLCDAMTYVQREYKPAKIIDLATLTGAILVALGHDYAGLFSNNDDLSRDLIAAGEMSGERLWRLPMGPSYDSMLNSTVADVKNVARSGPGSPAGSITAAQFLLRFVENDTPWAHLDIAGTAWKSGAEDPREPAWATGYGVRLLDRFIAETCEK